MMAITFTLCCGVTISFKGSEAFAISAMVVETSSFPAEGPSADVSSIVSAIIVMFVVFCYGSSSSSTRLLINLAALNVLALSEY